MSLKNSNVKIKIPNLLKNKLNNKKIGQIYKKFEKSLDIKENFVVAVSGGPDSLALAFLAKIYSIKNNLVSKFLIVDHKLRPDSTIEAKKVKRILKKNLIDIKILTWRGKKPTQNIQALARNKRYELLFAQSDKFKINNILLGHHQNDLLENFFIRMLRGSGLRGLISLDKKTKTSGKILLRPLLEQKKNDLVFTSKYVFNFYVQDPTNNDEKFQRIKVRRLIEKFIENGLDKKKFIKTIENLKSSNKVVDFYTYQNLRDNTFFSSKNKKLTLNKNFFNQPYEVVFRALTESIRLIGKKYYPARGKKVEKIIKDNGNHRSFKVTLGGCIIEKVKQTVIITKEL